MTDAVKRHTFTLVFLPLMLERREMTRRRWWGGPPCQARARPREGHGLMTRMRVMQVFHATRTVTVTQTSCDE